MRWRNPEDDLPGDFGAPHIGQATPVPPIL